ncbi:MAG: thioredoxin domain-containing protein [Nanoarchaeota archaeon]
MQTEVKGGSNMETEQKSDTITISKNSLWKYSTFVLLGIIVLGTAFFILPDKSTTGRVVDNPGDDIPTEPAAKVQVDIEGDPVKGKANAKVTLVQFEDYECPFCQKAALESLPALDKYVEDGTLRIVTKDYPLPFHSKAQKAAEAAHCARKQGGDAKYYEMHDLLFTSGVEGGVATFKEYAQQLNLNTAQFNTCLDSGEFEDEIKADLQYGSTIGVQGTPAFFMNGRMISGACPSQTFESGYQAEIDNKDWGVSNCRYFEA